MKKGLSLIAMIVDASGSMHSRSSVVVESINEAIRTHREAPGEAVMSIYSFASYGQIEKIVDFVNVNEVKEFKYTCGGMTALHDAIGKVIDEIGVKLASMNEEDRPEQVQIMIITDGGENDSRDYTVSDIKSKIEHQTTKYSWLFTYLGSNQDAILVGDRLGIAKGLCATYTDSNLKDTMGLVNRKSVRCRSLGGDYQAMTNTMEYSNLDREFISK